MSLERAVENALKIYANENPDFKDEALFITNMADGLQVRGYNLSPAKIILFLELAKMNVLNKMTDKS